MNTIELPCHSLKNIGPRKRIGIIAIFLVVIAIGLYSDIRLGYQVLSGDQLYYKLFNDILNNPMQYALDPVYSDPANTRMYTPLFLQLIKPFFAQFGYLLGLAVCQPIIGLLYLVSMFTMLYKFTGKIFISVFVALVSGAKIPAFPIEYWGALSLYQVMPRTLFLIFVPILFYVWLRYQYEKKVLSVLFFVCGLLTHLHPVSGVTFAAPLLFAQFFQTVLKEKNIKQFLLYFLLTVIPMVPFAFHYFGNSQEGLHLNLTQFNAFFNFTLQRYSFLKPTLGFPSNMDTFFATVTMLFFAGIAFFKSKNSLPKVTLQAGFLVGCLVVYLLFYAVNFLILFPNQIPPVLIDLPRGMKFLLLPSFLAVAVWLSQLKRKSIALSVGFAFVVIFNFIEYDALLNDITQHPSQVGHMLRHQFERYISTHGGPMNGEQKETKSFLLANESLANWIKASTPSSKTLIHASVKEKKHSSMMLRALSERSVTYAYKDGGLLYYTNKPAFIKWGETLNTLEAIRDKYGYCSGSELGFAKKIHANYLVCQNNAERVNLSHKLPLVYKNEVFSLYQI